VRLLVDNLGVNQKVHRLGFWGVFALAVGVHALAIENFFYTHDCYSALETGERLLRGEWSWHENVLRILPTLSFAPRAAFGTSMVAWHLPHLVLHGFNAALVLVLARRLGMARWPARLAGVLFGCAPLLAHAVEWLGAPYDLFVATGMLGACVAFLDRRPWRLAAFALMALLSKETALALPGILVALSWAIDGNPFQNNRLWPLVRRVWGVVALTIGCLVLRWLQFKLISYELMAGRSIAFSAGDFFATMFPALGAALVAPLDAWVGVQDPSITLGVGWAAVALVVLGLVGRRPLRPVNVALLVGGLLAMVPVLLVASELALMVANTRYLYVTAAFCAPVLALLVVGNAPTPSRWAWLLMALLAGGTVWGGIDRVQQSTATTSAVKPVVDSLSVVEPGSEVWVHSNLYDEATLRLLMSSWLHQSRGVRAVYALRGDPKVFVRTATGGMDASTSYFARRAGTTPSPGALHLMQTPSIAAVSARPRFDVAPEPKGPWRSVPVTLTPNQGLDDADDLPAIEDGNRVVVQRRLRHAQELRGPQVLVTLPEGVVTWSQLEWTIRAQSDAHPEYGVAFYHTFATVHWEPFDAHSFVTVPVIVDGTSQTVRLDLRADPARPQHPQRRLGLAPLNLPGTVTVESIRVR